MTDDPGSSVNDPIYMANRIIKWVRGQDQAEETYGSVSFPAMRSREIQGDTGPYTWRLGDIIHSTPVTVAGPSENYQLLYRDLTYADFADKYQYRRQMVYFGANDGMLHAVNGGFYRRTKDTVTFDVSQRFCLTDTCVITNGVEQNTDAAPALGTEMWAYVPYNLIPHLKCLTEPGYIGDQHKYFVDLRPRIFDVQIFNDDTDHPHGWGTILVGGMRFGGSPTTIDYLVDMDSDGTGETPDNRIFTSAYFILDITNPEKPPVLLAEFTKTFEDLNGNGMPDDNESSEVDLGFTTVISTMIPMKVSEDIDNDNVLDSTGPGQGEDTNCNSELDNFSKWYLVLGSGPTHLDATSAQQGSLSIVPLDRFVNTGGFDPVEDMRIPDAIPTVASGEFGRFELADSNSFISDLITVDIEINKNYMADVVYFGSVIGDWGSWGGKLNRLVLRDWITCNSRQTQIETKPSDWTGFSTLIDVGQPITASPTVATDGIDYWVYFGTGRFFDTLDKSDPGSNATQTFYGIREPVDDNCILSWEKVWNSRTDSGWSSDCLNLDPSLCCSEAHDSRCSLGDFGDYRGTLGLMRTDQIEILSTESETQPKTLGCLDDTTNCLPYDLVYTDAEAAGVTTANDPVVAGDTKTFNDLLEHITGDYFNCAGSNLGKDGWYRDFQEAKEKNLGQATLLGGITSFTTYRPYSDPCKEEGLGYLYGVYYLTGTAWYEDVFGTISADSDPREKNPVRLDLGKGLSTTPNIHIGSQQGGKAFIQTSVGKIVEIPQPNLPSKEYNEGRVKWRDIEQ
jgi:type IV pilus assembly protein PilY1